MKTRPILLVSLLMATVGAPAAKGQDEAVGTPADPAASMPPAAAASTVPPFARSLRVSALIKAGDIVKAGLINSDDGRHRFLEEGQEFYDVTIAAIDYENEAVTLEKDGQRFVLRLAEDPNAEETVPTYEPIGMDEIWRGEGIESFLREHPEAVIKTGPSLESLGYEPGPPVEGLGPGIEAYLKDKPEMREKLMKPAVGLGEGIESYLDEHPELREQLNQPVTGLGPGIESYLDEHPELREKIQQQRQSTQGLGPGIEEMRRQLEEQGITPPFEAE